MTPPSRFAQTQMRRRGAAKFLSRVNVNAPVVNVPVKSATLTYIPTFYGTNTISTTWDDQSSLSIIPLADMDINTSIDQGGDQRIGISFIVSQFGDMAQKAHALQLAFHQLAANMSITQIDDFPLPPPRAPAPIAFNRYINASDLLQEFIEFLNTQRVRRGEVMEMPLELFIKWLVIRACEADGEESDVTLELPHRKQPRCVRCRRYMPRTIAVPLHSGRCAERFFAGAMT